MLFIVLIGISVSAAISSIVFPSAARATTQSASVAIKAGRHSRLTALSHFADHFFTVPNGMPVSAAIVFP
jgi:hypothetical protein